MCSVPVTFGGGSWMQYEGASSRSDGLNSPWDSQYAYHLPSIVRGSKLFASSIGETVSKPRIIADGRGAPWRDAPRVGCGDREELALRRRDGLGVGHAV